jgi:ribose transport system ATP-binding protein
LGREVAVSAEKDPLVLELRNVGKTFPGQVALDRVNLTLRSGEIYGLVGHNGSGKSTLVKVLAGYHEPDPGSRIIVRGRELSSHDESAGSMHFIHQDLGLVGSMSTVENLALGAGYCTTRLKRIDWRRQRRITIDALSGFGASFDIDAPVDQLTLGERTMVAIARAFRREEKTSPILILDEPTAALHPDDAQQLFAATRRITEQGGSAIFVSHRLREVLALSDRIGVLREGVLVDERDARDFDEQSLIEQIVGQPMEDEPTSAPASRSDVVLRASGLTGRRVKQLRLDVHAGEIVGITGLEGSGKEEVAELLFGGHHPDSGHVRVLGNPIRPGSPRHALRAGMALVLGDRSRAVAILHPVRENLSILELSAFCRFGRIRRRSERQEVDRWLEHLQVRPRDPERRLGELSGGNQQKVVVAKWLRTGPRVLIMDEPTIGVDVGATFAIYQIVREAAASGVAVVICSSDARDLAKIADRVLVLREGVIAAELYGGRLTETQIVRETLGASPIVEERSVS